MMKLKLPYNVIAVILTTIFIITLLVINAVRQDKIEAQKGTINLLTSEIEKYRNSDSSLTVKVLMYDAENTKAFLRIKSQDSQINALQELVKTNKKVIGKEGMAAIVTTDTKVDLKSDTKVTHDTINDTIYPVYESRFNKNGWITGYVKASKDSTDVSLAVRNDYDIVVGKEKGNLKLIITSKNPYTDILSSKAVHIKKNPSNSGIGIIGGYGVGVKNNTPFLSPFIGVGFYKNLIRF